MADYFTITSCPEVCFPLLSCQLSILCKHVDARLAVNGNVVKVPRLLCATGAAILNDGAVIK